MVERVLADRYELRSVLGRGWMADVWQGFDRRLERMVAVKVLHPAGPADPFLATRFDREARIVARLAHPNILTIHDIGVDGGVAYQVMELVHGGLAERLTSGALDVTEAVRITTQLCDGLEAAHEAGIFHRGLKPANILITDTGQVKVVDFAIAHLPVTAHMNLRASARAADYMAPEQFTGEPVDGRTDVYALGCVLYAMLTGRPPFTGDNPMQVAVRHVTDTPSRASAGRPGLPAGLDQLLDAMLAKRPADRPATVAHVRTGLR